MQFHESNAVLGIDLKTAVDRLVNGVLGWSDTEQQFPVTITKLRETVLVQCTINADQNEQSGILAVEFTVHEWPELIWEAIA